MSNAAKKMEQMPSSPPNLQKKKFSQIQVSHPLDEVFKSDFYAIEQPFLQITQEGYTITCRNHQEQFSAVRHRQLFKTFIVSVGAMACFFPIVIGFNLFFSMFVHHPVALGLISLLSYGFAWLSAFAIYKKFLPIRSTTVTDKHGQEVFQIEPASGFFLFNPEFALKDKSGRTVILFKKRFIDSLLRKKWHAYTPKGKYIFSAVEDNIFMAILRRYLQLGKLIPLHFNFNKGGGKPFGSFKRKFSLRDKYQLNHNPKAAPAWIIIAMAILLDTGEKR